MPGTGGPRGTPELLSACSSRSMASGGTILGQCHAATEGRERAGELLSL